MDPAVIQALRAGEPGSDGSLGLKLPLILVEKGDDGKVRIPREEVALRFKERRVETKLKGVAELWAGNQAPPPMSGPPPPRYQPFLWLVERAAMEYCAVSGEVPTDDEFARVYQELVRRPDGKGPAPVFHFARAACRLYMSLEDISRAEYEALIERLGKSARHHRAGTVSRNYHAAVSKYVMART